jgi:hypothetical protein
MPAFVSFPDGGAEFTGPALLSIANSGQMVLKLRNKIESNSLILVNSFPLERRMLQLK